MILKIGKSYIHDDAIKKHPHQRLLSYKDVIGEKEGWIEVDKFLPNDFDLVYLKREGKKPIPGWIVGTKWEGIRLKKSDKVIAWRKIKEDSNEK